jgi:ABC-type Fe3+/spermidine/putrescine transport system ATPase subunit
MALVFQRGALFPHLTVAGNIEFGLRLQGMPAEERARRSTAWLERLGMSELALRRVSDISEGQAQRVALARALAPGFPVLLLDEPFSALDVQTRHELRPLVKKLVEEQGVSALLVTHDPEDASVLASQVLDIDKGRVTPR